MLYIEPNEYGEIVDFMFNAKPYNEDISLSDIAALEQFYKRSGYLPEKYVEMFLNYVFIMLEEKLLYHLILRLIIHFNLNVALLHQ